ncbi:hypothetical protein G6F58_004549 [Rhizopus delemar]|nr:hypothetical protein G6F58_004549 [Rhizopus delemar]
MVNQTPKTKTKNPLIKLNNLTNSIRENPPEVIRAEPYITPKARSTGKRPETPLTKRRVTTRSHLEEIKPSAIRQVHHNTSQPDTDTQMKENTTMKPKRRKRHLEIRYDIVTDVLDQKANITFRDLIKSTPAMRRKLAKACQPSTLHAKEASNDTMAVIEDDELNTTAVYTNISIGDKDIKTLIDCGAAKSCMSKALAETLGLQIDAASESIFTLGNGTKQPALGLIYDVPIQVKEGMIIPGTIEVLPHCPTPLIIGNNWLNRAKARIDFNSASLKVSYKNQKAELEISFLRKSVAPPKVTMYTQTYKNPISLTNSKSIKQVHFEEDSSSDIEQSDEESSPYDEEDEISEEETSELEYEEKPLLLLEDSNIEQVVIEEETEKYIIRASEDGLNLQANTSKSIHMDKPKADQNIWYNFEPTNDQLIVKSGYFDVCSSLVVNKKSIEIKLYNRTTEDVIFQPYEELGWLEKFNTQSILQAYEVEENLQLCMMEQNIEEKKEKEEPMLEHELFIKLETGEISVELERKLRKLLERYKHIFDWNNDTIGFTNLLAHKIIIKEDTHPISHRPYRMSPIEAEYLQKELEKYTKLGVITPSNSPWAAPIILVKKKNGEYRMVIDYRKLNAVTKKDAYPLPRIDDLLDTLGKAKVFSALDMRAGFHQVPMEESSKELTAFTTKFGTYHYNTLPMGLVNSPATFQRLIDLCFRSLINKCLVAYIDDLNVYSENSIEHLQHLDQVFNCIQIANLKLNPEKCFFFKDHLKFLGYIVTKEGIQTDPEKIKKIVDYPVPRTITQVRAFLGIASYYRRFIKNFASIARPLHDQTKTKKKLPWTKETTDSFVLLKKLLTTAPVLTRPDFTKSFILVTDASKLGLGCILTQLDENGKEHPVVYASRGLKSSEIHYAATKLECLAVIWAVKTFRPYLLGKKFTIITDHSALNGLLKTSNPTGIIARWITILSEYDYEVKYRPGRVNESADFLSRLGY